MNFVVRVIQIELKGRKVIVEKILKILKDKGIKYGWLADKLGITYSTFWRWCNDGVKPREIYLDKMAKIFDVDKKITFSKYYK